MTMTKEDRRRWLLADISRRLLDCNLDELQVFDIQLSRTELGRARYGYLDLSKFRDWAREEAEERIDADFYRSCAVLSKEAP